MNADFDRSTDGYWFSEPRIPGINTDFDRLLDGYWESLYLMVQRDGFWGKRNKIKPVALARVLIS